MITHLDGKLVEKTPTDIVVDCNGVGYSVSISLNTYSLLGNSERCKIYTHQVIREDAHVLFGFADKEERTVFRLLISVSGVGPNTARMILSSMSPNELRTAILEGNVAALKAVKGIGGKSAERIIVDLKDKIGKESGAETQNSLQSYNRNSEEALSALTALGFNKSSIQNVLKKVVEKEGSNLPVEEMIKLALKYL